MMELHGCHYMIREPIAVHYTPKTLGYESQYRFTSWTGQPMQIEPGTLGKAHTVLDQWYGPSYLVINFEGVFSSAHIQFRDLEHIETVAEADAARIQQLVEESRKRADHAAKFGFGT